MVEVVPFKGITYNHNKIDKFDSLMSPPYDIISDKMQTDLYESHPQNFVRLILGKQKSGDNESNNRYTRAKELLNQWFKDSILVESDDPSIFPYKIEYVINSKKKSWMDFSFY